MITIKNILGCKLKISKNRQYNDQQIYYFKDPVKILPSTKPYRECHLAAMIQDLLSHENYQ